VILQAFGDMARAAAGSTANTRRFLAGLFLMGLGQGAFEVHLNLYLRSLGFGQEDIGRVISATSLGVVLVSIPAALWVDRHPPGRVFVLSAAGFSASSLLMVFFPHLHVLVALAFLNGFFFTVHWVAEGPFFMRSEGPERRTELFGLAAALGALAVILAAAGTGFLARRLGGHLGSEAAGLRWGLAAASVVGLLAVVPYARIRTPAAAGPVRPWREYVVSRDSGLLLRLSIPQFLVGLGAGLTIPYLNLYFRDRFGKDPESIGAYFAVAQVLMTAGFVAGPALARRFTHVRVAVATELLSLPFFLLLAVTDHLGVAVGAFWMRGALMNMNQPVSQAFTMEVVPVDQQAVTNSLRTFAWNSAWMVSSASGGLLIQEYGHAPGMYATMGFYLLAAALFWTFFRGRVVGTGTAAAAPPTSP
jgi:predicted MFS family arabinose efflux permease